MAIMLFIFFIFLRSPTTAAGNPLVELSADYLRRLAGYGDERLSTVVVGGSLLCDACSDGISELQSNPITGASIVVSCDTGKKISKNDWVNGRTDEYGDFLIDLPSHLHAVPNFEKRCVVRVLDIPLSSPCHQAYNGQHIGIKLSSSKNGFRTYTAQEIHLRPKYSHSRIFIKIQSRVNIMVHMHILVRKPNITHSRC